MRGADSRDHSPRACSLERRGPQVKFTCRPELPRYQPYHYHQHHCPVPPLPPRTRTAVDPHQEEVEDEGEVVEKEKGEENTETCII
ncbi:hypothetical protein E2C01_014298 [Portunus trituberculatus]|uniref:Uncharacterized protein n=1 Tax=Portunus trituberculatus TaxID=210409 RepID=A0A5B7DJJ3_PORTR|nr:hypothetical protein [Portunus trituberculatus]